MDLAGLAGICDAGADLDGFDGVDRHYGLSDTAVELFVPRRVRAEADGNALGDDLKNAAERVAVCFCLVDQLDHLFLAAVVGTVQRRIVGIAAISSHVRHEAARPARGRA